MRTVVCDWKSWGKHLISFLAPDAQVVPIEPLHEAHALIERVLAVSTIPATVVVHIDNTFPAAVFPQLDVFAKSVSSRGFQVWNGRVRDISKRTLQAHNAAMNLPTASAARDGVPSERVLVKTNLNHHGLAESRVSPYERQALNWAPYAVTPIAGWPDYPVLARSEVPSDWWDDPRLSIERFIDNRDGVFYRTYFVGEQCVLLEGEGQSTVQRLQDARERTTFLLRRELADDVVTRAFLGSRAATAFCCSTRFADTYELDYGTLDLVVDDADIAYVVDVNICPYWGEPEGEDDMIEHLARGLASP